MKRNSLLVAALSLAVVSLTANAGVLWDQSDFDEFGAGFYNSESGMPPMGLTQHAVSDITVDGDGWVVDSITTYYTAVDTTWGEGISEGYLHVYDKTGALPVDGTNDPTTDPVVTMSAALVDNHFEVTASGLNLPLAAGDYWIGITPVAPGSMWGPEIQMSSMTCIGDATASYDPYDMFGSPTWFNFNPGLDATILIDGVPEPSSLLLLGMGVIGLIRRR